MTTEQGLEYLKQLDTVTTILLGWLLGLLTPAIAERIRRPYRCDLTRAVVDELLSLQYTMAFVAYQIRTRDAKVSDSFLDMILPIVESYNGPDRAEHVIEAMRKSRSLPERQRDAMYQQLRKPNVGMALRQYAIPLFATQIADLAICSVEFQRSVLHIRHHLDLFNQSVTYAQSQLDKTFNNPSPEDREALITNQEQAYRGAGTQAEMIVQAISRLQTRYGRRK